MYKALYQGNHPGIADLLINVSNAYGKLGDNYKDKELTIQAYLMRVQALGSNHPDAKSLKNYLEKNASEFISNNETREFIIQYGNSEETIIIVKQALQEKCLNKIQLSQEQEFWNTPHFQLNSSMFPNLNIHKNMLEYNLWKQLGYTATPQNLEIAKMLYFEAINLRIMAMAGEKDYSCAIAFSKKYPELIKKITNEHPEYFVDGSILRQCVSDRAMLKKLLGDNNPTGQGENDYAEVSYWNEYSKVAMEKMLELRLKAAGIEIDKENVKVISPNYVWDGFESTTEKLTKEILTALESSKQVLISLNLHNKHWVGISINKT